MRCLWGGQGGVKGVVVRDSEVEQRSADKKEDRIWRRGRSESIKNSRLALCILDCRLGCTIMDGRARYLVEKVRRRVGVPLRCLLSYYI